MRDRHPRGVVFVLDVGADAQHGAQGEGRVGGVGEPFYGVRAEGGARGAGEEDGGAGVGGADEGEDVRGGEGEGGEGGVAGGG